MPVLRMYNPADLETYHDSLLDCTPIVVIETPEIHRNPDYNLLVQHAESCGYRIATIEATSEAFNGANLTFYNFLVAYRGANFNIVPPKLAPYRVSVWDALKELHGRQVVCSDNGEFDSYPPIAPHEWENLIQYLPCGWSTCDFLLYHQLPQGDYRSFKRLGWRCGTWLSEGTLPIHPEENRALTSGELQFLCYDSHVEWIEQLVALFNKDHWKSQDWQSRYDIGCEQWLGKNVPGQFHKHFNLHCYRPFRYEHGLYDD